MENVVLGLARAASCAEDACVQRATRAQMTKLVRLAKAVYADSRNKTGNTCTRSRLVYGRGNIYSEAPTITNFLVPVRLRLIKTRIRTRTPCYRPLIIIVQLSESIAKQGRLPANQITDFPGKLDRGKL